MKVLIVSGIWPPDVGGPASHAPDVAAFLSGRGHDVEVVTTAEVPPPAPLYPVRAVPRRHRVGVRHLRGAALIQSRARKVDVVYTTGMFGRSALGSTLAWKPYVVKLTADPAFERSRRRGLVGGDVDEFQQRRGRPGIALLRFARDVELRRAAHVFTPSAYLRELALGWGVAADRVSVLPNPAPVLPPDLPPRDELRRTLGLNGATLAFAGRLTAQKSLGRTLEAVAGADGVQLVIAGEGPDRGQLEERAAELGIAGRVRFLGAQPRERIVELFRAADAAILSSSWENFPHTVVEALRRRHSRARHGGGRRRRGRTQRRERAARSSGGHRCAGRGSAPLLRRRGSTRAAASCRGALGRELRTGASARRARSDARASGQHVKPRVLFVSRRVELPLSPSLARKWDAIGAELDYRVLAGGSGSNGSFHLARELPALDGPAFFAALPLRIARELREFEPHAVLAQGAHETAAALGARKLARTHTAVIADLHGDWRAPTRLYGSRLRGLLSPVADRIALAALRRADGIRTVTGYTTALVRELGLEPADEFPAYMDFDSFLQEQPKPLPSSPRALFVGVLERYKNVDGLAEAWRRAAPRVPGAHLHIVGSGTLQPIVEQLVRDLPEQTSWAERLTPSEVASALDESTLLVLPSRSEGMGRVIVEAFSRARPVVGSSVGGIPDLVQHDRNGLLVEPGDTDGLAAALVRVLEDRDLAERLGAGAQSSAGLWTVSPADFAFRLRDLVDRITGLS